MGGEGIMLWWAWFLPWRTGCFSLSLDVLYGGPRRNIAIVDTKYMILKPEGKKIIYNLVLDSCSINRDCSELKVPVGNSPWIKITCRNLGTCAFVNLLFLTLYFVWIVVILKSESAIGYNKTLFVDWWLMKYSIGTPWLIPRIFERNETSRFQNNPADSVAEPDRSALFLEAGIGSGSALDLKSGSGSGTTFSSFRGSKTEP